MASLDSACVADLYTEAQIGEVSLYTHTCMQCYTLAVITLCV